MRSYKDICVGSYILAGLAVLALTIISAVYAISQRAVLYPAIALCCITVYTLLIFPAGYTVRREDNRLVPYKSRVLCMFFTGLSWLPAGVMLIGATLFSLILYLLEGYYESSIQTRP